MYKAQKRQKDYFIKLIAVVTIGVVLDAGFYAVYHSKESLAFATLVSAFLWLGLCVHDFSELSFKFKEISYLIIAVLSFVLCGMLLNSIAVFVVYIVLTIAAAFLLLRTEMKYLVSTVIDVVSGVKEQRIRRY